MDIQTLQSFKYVLEREIYEKKLKEIERIINKINDYSISTNDKHYQILDEIREDLKKFRLHYL